MNRLSTSVGPRMYMVQQAAVKSNVHFLLVLFLVAMRLTGVSLMGMRFIRFKTCYSALVWFWSNVHRGPVLRTVSNWSMFSSILYPDFTIGQVVKIM